MAAARALSETGPRPASNAMRSFMRMSHAVILACALGVVLGAWLVGAWRRLRERKRARDYNQRGQRAEREAVRLLEIEGYRIVERQLRTTYPVEVGGEVQQVALIVDFVVERRGERFAAEVKTGASAAGLEHAETRRQLLEYQLALGLDRVLLVDPERKRVSTVGFPIPPPVARVRPRILPWTAAAIAAFLLVAATAWYLVR